MIKKVLKSLKKNKNIILVLLTILTIGVTAYYYFFYNKSEKFTMDENNKVVYFYLPECVFCKEFKPTWDLLKGELAQNPNIKLNEVNASEERDLAEYYQITSFPTIAYINKNNDLELEYKGDRSIEDVLQWINKIEN